MAIAYVAGTAQNGGPPTQGSPLTITYSGSAAAGHVHIVFFGAQAGTNVFPVSNPDGYTILAQPTNGTNLGSCVALKKLTSGDITRGNTTFTWTSGLTSNAVWLDGCYSGVHDDLYDAFSDLSNTVGATSIAIDPVTTTTSNGMAVVFGYTARATVAVSGHGEPSGSPGGAELQEQGTGTTGAGQRRASMSHWLLSGGADLASQTIALETTGATSISMGWAVVLKEDFVAPTYNETLRPTSIRNLTGLTGAVTDIDDDPDSAGTDFLTGTDPSAQTGLTNGPEYPDATIGATGQTAFAWNTPGNITDASDTTFATEPSASTPKADYLSFNAADWTDIPSNATITGISYEIKHRAGTANRVSIFTQLGSVNGTLLGTEVQVGGAATIATTAGGVIQTGSYSGTMPTRAQMVTGTFGARLRMARSNTSTYDLYSIKLTATYDLPAATTNTSVEVLMDNPVGTLTTGAATGEIRLQIRKKGTGTNPQVRAEIHENASGTVLDTPILDTTVSDTTTDGTVLSGPFNQNVISVPNDVEVWIIGTGAAGGLVEIGAVEWNSVTAVAATQSTTVPGTPRVEQTGTTTSALQASQATTVAGTPRIEQTGTTSSALQASQATTVAGTPRVEQTGAVTTATQASQATSVAGTPRVEQTGSVTSALVIATQATSVTGKASDERGGAPSSAVQASQSTSVTGRATGQANGSHTTALTVPATMKTTLRREFIIGDNILIGGDLYLGGIGYVEPITAYGVVSVSGGASVKSTSVTGTGSGERTGLPSTSRQASQSTSLTGTDRGGASGTHTSVLSAVATMKTTLRREFIVGDDIFIGGDLYLGGIGYVEPITAYGAVSVSGGASAKSTSVTGEGSGERSGAVSSSRQASAATSITGKAADDRGGTHSSTLGTNLSTSVTGKATDAVSGTHTSGVGITPLTTTVTGRATDERTGIPGSALQAGMSTSVVGKNDSGASGTAPTSVSSVPVVGYAVVAVTQEVAPVISLTQETIPTITTTQEAAVVVGVTQAAETHTEIAQEDRVLVGVGQEAS